MAVPLFPENPMAIGNLPGYINGLPNPRLLPPAPTLHSPLPTSFPPLFFLLTHRSPFRSPSTSEFTNLPPATDDSVPPLLASREGQVEMSIFSRMDPPRGGALGKRKEREYSSTSSEQQHLLLPVKMLPVKTEPRKPSLPAARLARPPMPPPPPKGGGNMLLAGYLAHEFLRFGTLLGERPTAPSRKDPAAARPVPAPAPEPEHGRRYAEASWLLMAGGARVPGVVNPTQLGRWLRIKE